MCHNDYVLVKKKGVKSPFSIEIWHAYTGQFMIRKEQHIHDIFFYVLLVSMKIECCWWQSHGYCPHKLWFTKLALDWWFVFFPLSAYVVFIFGFFWGFFLNVCLSSIQWYQFARVVEILVNIKSLWFVSRRFRNPCCSPSFDTLKDINLLHLGTLSSSRKIQQTRAWLYRVDELDELNISQI